MRREVPPAFLLRTGSRRVFGEFLYHPAREGAALQTLFLRLIQFAFPQ